MISMSPYPKELRIRVVEAVEQGEFTIAEIATIFGVGLTFVKKMLRLHRAGLDLQPRHGGGAQPLLQDKERDLLRQEIAAQPDATLEELQQMLKLQAQISVSLSTLCRVLQQLGLPRKKKLSSPMSGTKKSAKSSARRPPDLT